MREARASRGSRPRRSLDRERHLCRQRTESAVTSEVEGGRRHYWTASLSEVEGFSMFEDMVVAA